jgi:pimeloyl-ACP methyl ester carboxylesterase
MSRKVALVKLAVRLVVLAGLIYAVVLVLAWRFQDRLAFPAPSGAVPEPADFGLADGSIVSVTTADGIELRGWYLPPTGDVRSRAPGLIWFHGNMETVGSIAPVLADFRPDGVGVLALDYRGYGESGGTPTEEGVYLDAEAAWSWLTDRAEIDSTRIAVYGRSIGSAVALYLAAERPVRAVILESPFTSGWEIAREHYALIPEGLVELGLDNLERARRLSAPLLVIHGTEDLIAPFEMGQAVAEAGRAEHLLVLEGAGHTSTYEEGGERYRSTVHDFLERHLGGAAAAPD